MKPEDIVLVLIGFVASVIAVMFTAVMIMLLGYCLGLWSVPCSVSDWEEVERPCAS